MSDEHYASKEISDAEQQAKQDKIVDLDAPKLKFYEELRSKAKVWTKNQGGVLGGKLSEYLFALPDLFVLLCRLATEKRIPAKSKILIGAIISYVIMPIDIVPDFIPVIGYLDDLVLVVLGLNMILNQIDKKILIDNWSGEVDVLELLQKISATAEQFMNKNVYQRIKGWFSDRI
ncbi:MAG: YkvA family protein [Candidatus Cloacimonetes bacterium]|nr:YkvA family protein [Candidatus Cloacimonadota bacterium]